MKLLHKIQYETEPYGTNQYSIEYTNGKYTGVKIVLGAVKLEENQKQDNCTLKYNYDIIEGIVEDSDKKEFDKKIADFGPGGRLEFVQMEITADLEK